MKSKRILSFFVTLALLMGAVPLPNMGGLLPDLVMKANAAEYTANPTTKDELVPLASSGSVSEAHVVKYANKDWYVIGYDGVGLASDSGTMTLFLKGTLGYHEFSGNNSNVYADSSIHSYLESYLANSDNFTNDQKAAVVARTLSGGGSTGNSYSGHVSGESVTANLWLLSAAEARKLPQNIIKSDGGGNGWWLRSPGNSGYANYMPVSPPEMNDVPKESGAAVGNSKSVRAAMLLALDSVIYSSETNTLIAQEAEAHNITASLDGDQGSVDAPSRADKGETVKFTITPAVGYAVDTVKFNDTSLSPVNGVYSFTMPNSDVTISVTFNQIYKVEDHIEQDGDTYTIKTAKGWEVFCDCVKSDAYHGFGGKTVKLGLDITDGVTVSAGILGKPFYGTFDGGGHTLAVALNSTDEEWVAPFSVFSGSIKNLTVTGTVAGSDYAGGLTGLTFGGSIENVTVNADISGSSKIGGITGYCNFGSLSVKNTVFNGSLQCDGDVCGLIGWASENVGYNQAITIENCLFNGTYTCDGEFHPITVRNADSEFQYTDNGAYYTVVPELSSNDYIICAGTHVSTITADNEFEITTDPTCSFDSVDYYAEGTAISLKVSGSIEGVVVNNGAVAVTDNQNGTYSFTMPDGNVTVENKIPHAHSFTYAADGAAITATCANTDGNCLLTNKQATLTIAAPTSLTYDGTAKAATVTGDTAVLGTPSITCTKQGDNTFTGTPTDAGTYTASITVEGQTASVSYTIAPKSVTITDLPVSNKEYDGTTTATATGGTIDGKVGNDDVSFTAGTAAFADANVGTGKTVTFSGYSLTGTAAGNYTLSAQPASVTADITAKSITGATVTLSESQLEYTGSEQSVSVSSVKLGDTLLTAGTDYDVTSGTTGTAKNTYTVTVTGKGNYKDTATATWKIPGEPMTVSAENVTATYDGQAHSITVTVSDPASYTIKYGESEGSYTLDASPTITNVGGSPKTVYFQVTADNYETYTGSATITINKAPLTVTAKPKTITYGDAPANNGVEYSDFVNGETSTVLSGTLGYDYSYEQFGDVGAYTITPKGLTAGNYAISFVAGTLTVEQKEVGLTWSSTPLTFDGTAQAPTATATGTVNNDAITVTVSGEQTNAGTGYTATASGLTGSKAGNYKLPATGLTQGFSIGKAAAQVLSNVELSKAAGTTSITASVTGKMPANAGTLGYTAGNATTTGSATVSNFTVDSTGTVSAEVYGVANDTVTLPVTISSTSYVDSTVSVVVTFVNKSDANVSISGESAKTYGDAAFMLTATATEGTNGAWTWESSNTGVATVTNGVVTIVGGGTTAITASYDSDTTTGSASLMLTVNPKSVAIPTAASGLKWTGSAQTGVASGEGYTVANGTGTAVGNYTATATLTNTVNYKWSDGTTGAKSIPWSIAKADGPAAPTGLATVAPTTDGGNDGKITGVTTEMEYSANGSSYTPCSGTEITGLSAGTYYVRYQETATHEAGAAATVSVPAYNPPATSTVATPTFSPADGTFTSARNVTIFCATDGATIHYTTDGTTPTESSPTYSAPIRISATTTIKAIAVKSGWTDSAAVSATFTLKSSSNGGSTGGSTGGGSAPSSAPVTVSPDGSKTTTTTNADGSKTAVTTARDGSTTTTTTAKDGSATTTEKTADGSIGTVRTDAQGNTVSAEAAPSAKAISDDAAKGKPITLPVEVKATSDAGSAAEISVTLPANSGSVKVEIPTENLTPGTVAVIVHADGTEEIVKTSTTGADGVVLTLDGSATVKIVDNTKPMSDVTGNEWYADSVAWATSHEVMNGMGDGSFAPNEATTQGMMEQLLYNIGGNGPVAPAEGEPWWTAADGWAESDGITNGIAAHDPAAPAARETDVLMLFNYAKAKGCDVSARANLSRFADADSVSAEAREAMAWAVAAGLINGTTDEQGNVVLAPQDVATRAQITAIIERFCENVIK